MVITLVEMRIAGSPDGSRWSVRHIEAGRERWLTLADFASIPEAQAWCVRYVRAPLVYEVRPHDGPEYPMLGPDRIALRPS